MGLSARKVPKTIYITPEQNEALEILAKLTKVAQSEFIREGIEWTLKKYHEVIKSSNGEKILIMQEDQDKEVSNK